MSHKILVIGSTNVDFLIKSDKLPSFGETVTGGIFMQNFGGKGANQAVGAARAGGDVSFYYLPGRGFICEPSCFAVLKEMALILNMFSGTRNPLPDQP